MARDPRNFIVNTQDWPMDFVVGYWETTATSSNYDQTIVQIAHALRYPPLLFGVYSLDDGATWMPVGLNDYYTNQADCWVEADDVKIYVNFTCLASGSKTAKLKLWGLMPTTADQSNIVPSNANVFFLDTRDYDYSKLVAAGRWSFQTGQNTVVAHNLGYIPEALVWAETSNGRIAPFDITWSSNTSYIGDNYVYLTTSELISKQTSSDYHADSISYLHYRIYGARNGA